MQRLCVYPYELTKKSGHKFNLRGSFGMVQKVLFLANTEREKFSQAVL